MPRRYLCISNCSITINVCDIISPTINLSLDCVTATCQTSLSENLRETLLPLKIVHHKNRSRIYLVKRFFFSLVNSPVCDLAFRATIIKLLIEQSIALLEQYTEIETKEFSAFSSCINKNLYFLIPCVRRQQLSLQTKFRITVN